MLNHHNPYNDAEDIVYVMMRCEFFRAGMRSLFSNHEINLCFIKNIEEALIRNELTLTVLLVLDMSNIQSMRDFKSAVDFLNQINGQKKIAVLVNRYNAYLTKYIHYKFHENVTFFNAHSLQGGCFTRSFLSWTRGGRFHPMHAVSRFRDNHYGFSMKEWISLIVPLFGETMLEMSTCLGVNPKSLYQTRQNALKKIGIKTYRDFCQIYLSGDVAIKNNGFFYR